MKHTRTSCKLISIILCLALALPIAGCGETVENKSTVFAMDTNMTLIAYGNNGQKGLRAAESIVLSLDAALDPDNENGIVYKMNHAQGQSTVVSGQIADMLSTAQTVYSHSKGALDLTIYPLVKRWGFADSNYYVPTDEEIASDLERLCFDQLVLTPFPSSGSYSVIIPEYAEITFAAAARGCASANAVEAMRQAGVTSGVVSMSGNVQTLGRKPNGSNWSVAITDPNAPSTYFGVVSVGETAIVTSGAYQRNFVNKADGKFYHHILKPSSGYPVSGVLSSVTVICEDGIMADCLSTALYIMGESAALNYWRTRGGFEMVLVTTDNRVVCTSGLIEQFTLTSDNYTLKFSE